MKVFNEMRWFLLMIMMVVGGVNLYAEEHALYGDTKLVVNGTVGTINVASPGDLQHTNYYYTKDSESIIDLIGSLSKVVVTGTITKEDAENLPPANVRVDLSGTTGGIMSKINGPWSVIVLPENTSISSIKMENPYQLTHIIVAGTPLKVYVRNESTNYLTDELVNNATDLYVYDMSGNQIDDQNTDKLRNQGKKVNGVKSGVVYNPLTINADNGDVATTINGFVTDEQKISVLTITGNLSDLNVLNGVEAQSVDLSGLTNSSIEGLKLPTTTGEIKLPGGTTYNSGAVVNTSSVAIEKLAEQLAVLKNNGKSISSVSFPNGVSYSGNAITNTSGVSLDDLKKEIKMLKDNGCAVNHVALPNGSTWQNGVVTLSSSDEANAVDVINALKNAGLSVTGIIFANGTTFTNGKLTTVTADDDTIEHLKARAELIRVAFGDDAITSARLSDKTEWSNDGSAVLNDEDSKDATIAKLNEAGFTVDETKVSVNAVSGQYVTMYKGVVTLTLPAGKSVSQILQSDSGITAEEINALMNNNNWKLVGSFTRDDIYALDKKNNHITSLDLSEAMLPSDYAFDCWKSSVESLTLPGNPNYTKIPEGFFNGSTSLKEIIIPTNIEEIGKNAFQDDKAVTTITFLEPSHVKTLAEGCFQRTSPTEVTIPGSVQTIETMAFGGQETGTLTQVVFAEATDEDGKSVVDMTIATDAFNNQKQITDVYVETLGKIICSSMAFYQDITNAHGDPSKNVATLHFPEDAKASDYVNFENDYALTYEIAKSPGEYHKWLNRRFEYALEKPNGWWEFVSNGTSSGRAEAITSGKFLKTYSNAHYDHIVPEGVKAYIVNGVFYDQDKKYYKLTLKSVNIIPKNTGVILYGQANSKTKDGQPTLTLSVTYLLDVNLKDDAKPLARDEKNVYGKGDWGYLVQDGDNVNGGDGLRNYLVPTATKDGSPVHVGPYDLDDDGKVAWRNFGLGWFSSTVEKFRKRYQKEGINDFIGFFRLLEGDMGSGKAYLRLRSSEYQESTGMEGVVVPDPDYRKEVKSDGNNVSDWTEEDLKKHGFWQQGVATSAWWATDWGVRNLDDAHPAAKYMGEPFFQEVSEGVATLIIPDVSASEESGDYYTLQGVKVASPSKGVYIKSGKKVVVR